MILEGIVIVSVGAAAVYAAKHYKLKATVAAEVKKIEGEIPALEASAKSAVSKVVDRIKTLL